MKTASMKSGATHSGSSNRGAAWLATVVISLGVSLGGCGSEASHVTPGAGGHADAASRLDEHRTLGDPIVAENLTVWPVYTDAPLDIGEFLTLQEAQERKVAVIRELGRPARDDAGSNDTGSNDTGSNDTGSNDAGSNDTGSNDTGAQPAGQRREAAQEEVPEAAGFEVVTAGEFVDDAAEVNRVVIENQGELPILVVAGTIIDGGKQDRQIGQDFVIAAGQTVDVDAFCVEQGRWSAGEQTIAVDDEVEIQVSDRIGAAPHRGGSGLHFSSSPTLGIAPKSVRSAGQYEKDQQKVWDKVAGMLSEVEGATNATNTLMGAVEQADEKALAKRSAVEKTVLDAFAALAKAKAGPIGFAYAINGKPVTVRAFAHERILHSQLPPFVKAMAVEAEMAANKKEAGGKEAGTRATAADVIAMVKAIEAAEEKLFETRASNDNGYCGNETGFRARCYLKGGLLKSGLARTGVGPDVVILTEDWTAR